MLGSHGLPAPRLGAGRNWVLSPQAVINGALAMGCAYVIYKISRVDDWSWPCWLFLLLVCADVKADQKEIPWSIWLPRGFVMLSVPYLLYRFAPGMWDNVLSWQESYVHWIYNWNDAFARIPLNDGWIFRLYHPMWLTWICRWAYSFGFAMIVWVAVIRCFFAKDGRKAIRYILSAHTLQLPLIISFYNTVMLQEVWYVLGEPDGMARSFGPGELVTVVRNCFPSMHTSIAFAILFLARREKGTFYSRLMTFYGGAIIFATLYLEIHWVLDVIGGILLGWAAVKLVDWLLARWWPEAPAVHAAPTGGLIETVQA